MTAAVAALLLDTLRVRGAVDADGLGRRWSTLNLSGLPALAEYEGCALWLYQRLNDLRILDAVPAAFTAWLTARAHRLAARNMLVDAQRDELVRLLNEFRVPHVLLKGAAQRLLAKAYPYADARATTDVDVLLPQEVARPAWIRLQTAGFVAARDPHGRYEGHIHLPPLRNGRGVSVELHTSTSRYVPAALAWQRVNGSAHAVGCSGGPTRAPAATELLWHAISHAPLPHPFAFRLRFLQDAAVVWAAGMDVDWSLIAARFGSGELPDGACARRWLGTAARLTGIPNTDSRAGGLPAFDLLTALSWRLNIFRLFRVDGDRKARAVWGRHAVSRVRRLLIDEGTCALLNLPRTPPPSNGTWLRRAGRRVAAGAARCCYRAWRVFHRA